MSLLSELKRRNVIRVGIAYLLGAWVLLQSADFGLQVIDAPNWVLQALVLVAAIGLPAVLVFAWVFEMTPEGLKKESAIDRDHSIAAHTGKKLNHVITGFLVLAVLTLLWDRFLGQGATRLEDVPDRTEIQAENASATTDRTPKQATKQGAEIEEAPSVAVLPFVNMSPDPDNEYFSDGISEELLNLLVRIDGLRVPSRTSSFAFKGMNTDIKDIAGQLDVGHILEGSVRKAGNRVRVTAQLIDVSTDTHLWSDTYDRELEDIFAIQDEIASHIVDALQVVLSSTIEQDMLTQSLEAYELYLQGRYLFQQRGPGVKEAERLLLQAVELDPDFAQAWATLAMTYVVFPNYLGMQWSDYQDASMRAAQRALEIDPGLAEARLALAQAAQRDLRWADSLSLYEQVVADDPRNALANLWTGITLLQAGYISEARERLTRAVELDPIASINLDWLARSINMSGDFESSLEPAAKGIQFGRLPAATTMLHYGIETGNTQRALDLLETLNIRSPRLTVLALKVYQGILTAEEATAIIGRVEHSLMPRYWKHMSMYLQEDASGFYDAFGEIYEFDDTIITTVWWHHSRWFRQSPLMAQHVADFQLLELWKQRGWPDLCRPVNENEFECD